MEIPAIAVEPILVLAPWPGEFRLRGPGKCVVAGATPSSKPLSVPFETAELSTVRTLWAKARPRR